MPWGDMLVPWRVFIFTFESKQTFDIIVHFFCHWQYVHVSVKLRRQVDCGPSTTRASTATGQKLHSHIIREVNEHIDSVWLKGFHTGWSEKKPKPRLFAVYQGLYYPII